MSLLERFFPIVRHEFDFFENARMNWREQFLAMDKQRMSMEEHMDQQMAMMRQRLNQLTPFEPDGNAIREIKPQHPVVEERLESKLKINFNVHGFKPEEVKVKILGDNILQVVADSTEKTDKGEVKRYHMSQYTLPKGISADQIKPVLSKDGVLTVEAPAPQLGPSEKLIPIAYQQ